MISKKISSSNIPLIILLGGQSGSGKSSRAREILKENPNTILVDLDLLKTFHPRFDLILTQYQDKAHEKLKKFAMKLRDKLIDKALEEKYNLLIEMTFNSSKTPIEILQIFKNANYKTEVIIQTTNKEISTKSCAERKLITKRHVDINFHNNLVKKLANNIKEVYESNLVDNMKIYIRTNNSYEELKITNSTFDVKLLNKYIGF